MTDFALMLDGNNRPQAALGPADATLNALMLSLHIRRGAWFFNPDFGSRLHEIRTTSDRDIALARQYALEAVQWLLDAKIANTIELEVTPQRGGRLNFTFGIDGSEFDVPLPGWENPPPPDPGLEIVEFAASAESDTPELLFDDDTFNLRWTVTGATEAWISGLAASPVAVAPANGTLTGLAPSAGGAMTFTLTARDAEGNHIEKTLEITVRGTFTAEAEFIVLPAQIIRAPRELLFRWNIFTPIVTEATFRGAAVKLSDERAVFVAQTQTFELRAFTDARKLRGTLRLKVVLDGGLDMSPWLWGATGAPRPKPDIPTPGARPERVWRDEHSPDGELLIESVTGAVGEPRPLPDIPTPGARPERVWRDEHSPAGELLIKSVSGHIL
jgi:phage gp46-like protein